MNNNPFIKQEIKILKLGYILHILLYILLLTSHILLYNKTYWLSIYISKIIFSEIFILSIFILLPIIILIMLSCKVLTELLIKRLKIISLIFLVIFLMNSLLSSVVIWYNAKLLETFYEDCPFNFKIIDIPNIFLNYKIDNYELARKKCSYRRCFRYNLIQSNYICNFPEKRNQIPFYEYNPSNSILIKEVQDYVDFCKYYVNFYKKEKVKINKYIFSYNFICLDSKDVILNDILSFLFIFANIFASTVSWLYEYYSYKKILLLFIFGENHFNQWHPSLKDTNNTSKIEENNNQNNGEENNNITNFIKMPTDIIIVEKNNKNINNINNDTNEERIVNIFKNNKKSNEINNNVDIINNNILNENKNSDDKSEQQLIQNQNIFKVINKENK